MDSLAQAARAAPSSQRHGSKSRSSSRGRGLDSDSSQPWTAARCQRLLRQLQSRLASLRRLISEHRSVPSAVQKRASDNGQDSTAKRVRITYGPRTGKAASTTDNSTTTPQRSVRTLGTMKLGNLSPTSELVDFRTPVWRKIRDHIDTPAKNIDIEYGLLDSLPSELADELNSIRRHVPNELYRNYEAIFHWLNRLLHSTTSQGKHTGGKSLLAMCLRKIPACIADIDAWDRQQLKENGIESVWAMSDAASDIFDQLEALGSSRFGWQPLRLVVRSQAAHLLSNAIAEGLFRPEFCNILVRLCVHLTGSQEAAQLVSAINRHQISKIRAGASHLIHSRDFSFLWAMLNTFKGKRLPGPVYECVSALMNKGFLSSSWLSTRDFSSFWISSLEGLASGNTKPHIVEFICIAIWKLARGSRSKAADCWAIEQALIRVVAGLAVAAITLENQIIVGEREQRKSAWRRLVYVLECSISLIARYRSRKSPPDNASFLLVFARYLAVADSDLASPAFKRRAVEDFESTAQKIDTGRNNGAQYQHTVILLCTVIQCRRRSCRASSQDILSDVCSNLSRRKLPNWLGHGLQKDVAFMLAQKTEDLRDLTFAESLPVHESTNAKFSTIFSGWRWEEGISEWVLPSPKQTIGRDDATPIKLANQSDVETETCWDTDEDLSLGIIQRRDARRIVTHIRKQDAGASVLRKKQMRISNIHAVAITDIDDTSYKPATGYMELGKSSGRQPKTTKPFYILSQLHADLRDEIDELI